MGLVHTREVLLNQERAEVPNHLGQCVLNSLREAKQGVSSMEKRAHAIIVWPRKSHDIRTMRKFSVGLRISSAYNLRCNGRDEADCYFCHRTVFP